MPLSGANCSISIFSRVLNGVVEASVLKVKVSCPAYLPSHSLSTNLKIFRCPDGRTWKSVITLSQPPLPCPIVWADRTILGLLFQVYSGEHGTTAR